MNLHCLHSEKLHSQFTLQGTKSKVLDTDESSCYRIKKMSLWTNRETVEVLPLCPRRCVSSPSPQKNQCLRRQSGDFLKEVLLI